MSTPSESDDLYPVRAGQSRRVVAVAVLVPLLLIVAVWMGIHMAEEREKEASAEAMKALEQAREGIERIKRM